MLSMILATSGWGLWWLVLALRRFAPEWYPGLGTVYWITTAATSIGLFLAIFTVRARLIWVLLPAVPILANASLLALPWIVDEDVLEILEESP